MKCPDRSCGAEWNTPAGEMHSPICPFYQAWISARWHASRPARVEPLPGGVRGEQLRRDLGLSIWIMAGLHEGKMDPENYPPERQRERVGELLWELTELIVKAQPR